MKKTSLILAIILFLGFSLRLYRLSSLPPGLTWDEAALGYNAYSILKTARDEHGAFLPLIFKSFGDYKPGLYVYLTVPFVALFGLNEFAVRLPSVVFGTLAIYGVYLLVTSLKLKTSNKPGLLAALALALSPWHIHFSRGAWEVNVFVTILLFAIYFFIKSLKNPKYFIFWTLLSASTVLVYQGAKMLTPLVFLALLIIYFPKVKKILSSWMAPQSHRIILVFLGLSLSILFIQNLTGPAGNRLTRLSIFGYRPEISGNKLFHNQAQLTSQLIASRYLYHFSPEVLFYQGNVVTERGHLPKQGMLYITDAFLLLLGLVVLVRSKNKQSRFLILSLLFLSPLPASLTLSEFSTVRGLFMVIPLSIISALGLYYLLTQTKKIISFPILVFIVLNTILTLNIYFNHSFETLAKEFNYGYKQAFEQINSLPKADKIIFTDVYGQPYIYYLFYNQFNPKDYQRLNSYQSQGVDVGKVDRVGDKIEFHQFSQSEIFNHSNTWFVGSKGNIQDKFDPTDSRVEYYSEIKILNKDPVFRLVKTFSDYEK